MTAPWFRTTDLARWGASNSGGDLSATMFDENTYYFQQAILSLQTAVAVGGTTIDHFVIVGNQLTVVMTDHTERGPYTLPTSAFNWTGNWVAGNVYAVNDVFSENGSIYIVIFPHTSGTTFNAGANDGSGHNFYALMLAIPGNTLPTGGAVGQMLIKSTTADFAVTWGWPLPTGGTTNQVLLKNSSVNQDASWHTSPWVWAPPASPAGHAGQVLTTVDGSSTNTEWSTPFTGAGFVTAPPASPAGTAGQILATVDGTHTNMEWVNAGAGSLAALSDVNVSEGSAIDGYVLAWDNVTSFWEAKPGGRNKVVTTLGSTGTVSLDPSLGNVFLVQPTGNVTINATSTAPGAIIAVLIETFGTTSFTVTFGSDMISQGPITTGTVSGKRFGVSFAGDSGAYGLIETGRTPAM